MEAKNRSASEVCAEFCQSGLTQKAFCESRGIPKSTLGYWLRRERKRTQAVVQLVRVAAPVHREASGKVVVRLGGGITIEIERPIQAEELRVILETAGSV